MNEVKKAKAKKKVEEIKNNAKAKCRNALTWVVEHPAETSIIVTLGGFAVKLAATAVKHEQTVFEENKQARMVWDPSIGQWLECKTRLSGNDRIRLAELVNDGYSRVDALKLMRKI